MISVTGVLAITAFVYVTWMLLNRLYIRLIDETMKALRRGLNEYPWKAERVSVGEIDGVVPERGWDPRWYGNLNPLHYSVLNNSTIILTETNEAGEINYCVSVQFKFATRQIYATFYSNQREQADRMVLLLEKQIKFLLEFGGKVQEKILTKTKVSI